MPRRLKIKPSDYPQFIGELSKEQKVLFYEMFAHRLTIAIRDFWSNENTSDSTKVSQMKWVNEILHRVTAKSRVERLSLHEWSESEFNEMIIRYVKKEPSIGSMVAWSITSSYERICDNGN